ncbi:MAG: hypothetical protein ABSG68_22520 [Thermoguttaceae bacterium]|jgi:hypothetical protein
MKTISSPSATCSSAAKSVSWLDGLLDAVFGWLNGPLVKQTAGEVARESHADAWTCLYERTCGMSLPQARGYIRAQAAEFIAAEVDTVLARRRIGPYLRPQIVDEAIEQLIAMLVEDVRCTAGQQADLARAA